jgi:SPP1 gp7 family putative phage head morphogenesis protein
LIGRPRELVVRSAITGAALFEDFRDQLAYDLSRVTSESAALEAAERWGREVVDKSPALANLIWQANAQTHVAGQLFVRDIEVGSKSRSLEAKGETADNFVNLAFAEAIDQFESRAIMPADEFDELIDAERSRAFTVRNAVSTGVVRQAFTQIRNAMAPGGPGLGEFIENLQAGTDASGYPGGVRRYLEAVFRTSTATSYAAGRYRQQTDPELGSGLFWEFLTVGDSRVRPEHAALEGKQWPVGDPDGANAYPPLGYQCRCVMRVIEDPDEAQLGRTVDISGATDEGFSGAPSIE